MLIVRTFSDDDGNVFKLMFNFTDLTFTLFKEKEVGTEIATVPFDISLELIPGSYSYQLNYSRFIDSTTEEP